MISTEGVAAMADISRFRAPTASVTVYWPPVSMSLRRKSTARELEPSASRAKTSPWPLAKSAFIEQKPTPLDEAALIGPTIQSLLGRLAENLSVAGRAAARQTAAAERVVRHRAACIEA